MKKWNNPELFTLGIESTKTEDCSSYANDKHPCHKTGNGAHGGNDNIDVPGQGNGHPATTCEQHTYCCCFDLPTTS